MVVIAQVNLEAKNTCSLVVTSVTTVGTTTYNNYDNVCITNSSEITTTFFKIVMWFLRLFLIYLFIYYNWVMWLKNKMLDLGIGKR